MNATAKTGWEMMAEYEESVERRAYVLARGQHPAYNMVPLMELIREADRLGYAVTTKPGAES